MAHGSRPLVPGSPISSPMRVERTQARRRREDGMAGLRQGGETGRGQRRFAYPLPQALQASMQSRTGTALLALHTVPYVGMNMRAYVLERCA